MQNCWQSLAISMIDVKKALLQAVTQLQTSDSARIDAEILLAHALMKTRTYLYSHHEDELTQLQWQNFQRLIIQRQEGIPIAYLIGTREFWSLPLQVNEDTLIPRPETELLVEICLSLLKNKSPADILDLGTGSGAVALALATERPDWQIIASDCSEGALRTAEENAAALNCKNIIFYNSEWFAKIPYELGFDAIISNPPYIAIGDPHLSVGDVRYEPKLALISGEKGLDALEHIIKHSLARLKPDGLLLLEHGYEQKYIVRSMLKDYGFGMIESWQDWQGNDRVSGGKRISS